MAMQIIKTPDVVRINHAEVQRIIRQTVEAETGRKVATNQQGVQADHEGDHFACCVTLTDDVIPKKETLAEALVREVRLMRAGRVEQVRPQLSQETREALSHLIGHLTAQGHLTLAQKESV